VDSQPVRFSRKAQQRPLDLLKAIIAFGGQDVSESQLTDALWPEAEGDAGHQAFAVTLHRLRKLIGQENIELKGRRVSLCRLPCYVDVWAFERLLEQAEAAAQKGDQELSHRFREKALTLYAGAFLADEPAPWPKSLRARLKKKFARTVLQQGRVWEDSGQYEKAVEWLEKGLKSDPSADDLRSALGVVRNRLTGAESTDKRVLGR
jgi:two-component SAPR family response regulator